MAISSQNIGKEIADIFGLKNVVSMDFYFAVNNIVSVDVRFYPEEDEIRKLMSIWKRYRLEKTGKDPYEGLIPLLQKFNFVEKDTSKEYNIDESSCEQNNLSKIILAKR